MPLEDWLKCTVPVDEEERLAVDFRIEGSYSEHLQPFIVVIVGEYY